MASSFPLPSADFFFSCKGLLAMRSRFQNIQDAGLKTPALHSNLKPEKLYQQGPVASRGRVKIHGPLLVTATVCSKCAESLPSVVTAVQSSSSTLTPGPPVFTIGSIARTIPSCSFGPCPGDP